MERREHFSLMQVWLCGVESRGAASGGGTRWVVDSARLPRGPPLRRRSLRTTWRHEVVVVVVVVVVVAAAGRGPDQLAGRDQSIVPPCPLALLLSSSSYSTTNVAAASSRAASRQTLTGREGAAPGQRASHPLARGGRQGAGD
ncbi:hypothetical protein E2C01_094931 [Portunus trituberculatus]|uniref:Uncharacterized protein n=1 Tax=Portunus trituberculatus TaxID=210409 RepID=A0A5B7JTT2_PORTR|nr:hypothetical protein [Portunus trituberculatus]